MQKNLTKTICFIIAVVSSILLYQKNLIWLVSKWLDNPDYSHGPLIPLISLYIGWAKKEKLSKIENRDGSLVGLVVIFFAVVIQILSIRADVSLTSSYSFILIVYGIILTYYGKEVSKELLFSISYLFFMVPFLGFFINPISNELKLLSAFLSEKIIYFLGISIYREGVILNLSGGSIEVADPCSGIRSMISLLALGTIFAYFTESSLVKRIIIIVSAIPLAVLGNLVRIVFSALMTSEGFNVTKGLVHTLSGLLVFLIAFIGLICIRSTLKTEKTV